MDNKIKGRGFTMILLLLLLSTWGLSASAQERRGTDFDHLRTGFPLTGAHAQVECQTCHVRGILKGTPTQCQLCHTPGSRSAATSKPTNHVPTALPCEQCHTSTVSWAGARFPHTGVAPGSCANCHNGSTASGKHARHIQTTQSCDTCHRTTAWIPASFSHAAVAPGTCATCHNGTTATGKSATHFVTTRSCDSCHSTTVWTPVRYTHNSPNYSAHNSGVTCSGCHRGNTETISWPHAAYQPACAGCHAGNYRPDPHKKTEVPTTIRYTVDELRNCAGSCHEYTDNTFSAIRRTRNGEHRSTDGGF